MNVQALIQELQKLDPNTEIILQKDGEGNGYSPLCGIEEAVYIAENTYSGSVYSLSRSAEDNGFEEDEWEKIKNCKDARCAVMYPIN